MQQWVKNRTAPYKYPRVIEYVEELPKTVNGKIRRAVIRDADNPQDAAAKKDKKPVEGLI